MILGTRIKEVWNRLPYPIFISIGKIVNRIPIGWRISKGVQERYQLMKLGEKWSDEKIQRWQFDKIKRVIVNANKNCYWYKQKYEKAGININEIKSIEDIGCLPTLTKKEVRDNSEDIISKEAKHKSLNKIITGGSTGTPLVFYAGEHRNEIELAAVLFIIRRLECDISDKVLIIRMPAKKTNPSNPYWTYYAHKNQLVINPFLISERSINKMAKGVEKFKPDYVMGAPNAIALFSSLIIKAGININISPKFTLISSENTYKEQRKLISKVFNCKTLDLYGQTEQVSLAFELNEFAGYHVNPFYSYTEIIDEKGKILSEPGDVGEVVGTTFENYTMPLIRYRTGDIARIGYGKSLWGQNGKILERIEGRTVDVVQTLDGRWMNIHGLLFGRHEDTLQRVSRVQIEQNKPGIIMIRVIKGMGFSKDDEKNIKQQLYDFTNGKLETNFEYVEEIKLTERGKHKFLIQHLKIPF